MSISTQNSTGSSIINKFIRKINFVREKTLETFVPEHFILKVVGNEEYIFCNDKHLLIEYESIRHAVRNEDDVKFKLIHKPDLKKIIKEATIAQQQHIKSFSFKNKNTSQQTLQYEKHGYGDGEYLHDLKNESKQTQKLPKIHIKNQPVNNSDNIKIINSFTKHVNHQTIKNVLPPLNQKLIKLQQPPKLIKYSPNKLKLPKQRKFILPKKLSQSFCESIWLRNHVKQINEQNNMKICLLEDYNELYKIRVCNLKNATKLPKFINKISSIKKIIVRHELWIGSSIYSEVSFSTPQICRMHDNMRFADWKTSDTIKYSDLPREAVISFTVYGLSLNTKTRRCRDQETALGYVRLPIIDHRHKLVNGIYTLNIWPIPIFEKRHKNGPKADHFGDEEFRFRGTTRDNYVDNNDGCQLIVDFGERDFDVVAPLLNINTIISDNENNENNEQKHNELESGKFTDNEWKQIYEIISRNVLEDINYMEKTLIWKARDTLVKMSSALPVFLKCVDWRDKHARTVAYKYLCKWESPVFLENVLELLGYEFMDTRVREYAVMCLSVMHDCQLQKYLLQLVQCLKFELHHNNILIRFLMRRALLNPYQIGHYFFWYLKCEYENHLEWCERFGLYMQEYILYCSHHHSIQLLIQHNLVTLLTNIMEKISQEIQLLEKEEVDKMIWNRKLHEELIKLNNKFSTISLPLNPKWRCGNLILEKCYYVNYEADTIALTFQNIDDAANNIELLFKTKYDLRQDVLTMQIFKTMDKIFLDRGLNLRFNYYNVVALAPNVGMVEIDTVDSKTTNYIYTSSTYGDTPQKLCSVLCRDASTHLKFLKRYNLNTTKLIAARNNYARSCAFYCIATHLLGIEGRHSNNILIKTTNGVLYHMNFAHFLGNYKSIFANNISWQRERAPFIFLPAMKYCVDNGGKDTCMYDNFQQWFIDAFVACRVRHRLLLNLFMLMIPSMLPELVNKRDLKYIVQKLRFHVPLDKIDKYCKQTIKRCLNDKSTIMSNMFCAVKEHRKPT
eukprot:125670_1